MAINIYSKDSVDSLLSAKLSISSLSNGATSTLNSTAPTTGQALTFDGTDLVWATGGGSFNGGAIANPITIAGATYDSEMSSDFFGVELSSDNSKYGELTYNSLTVVDGAASTTVSPTNVVTADGVNGTTSVNSGNIDIAGTSPTDEIFISANDQTITLYTSGSALSVTPTHITFPDSTTQSTAGWTSGSGDLSLGGYSLTNGNVDCSAGYVTAQNITLTSGGVLTFPDSTTQSTAAVVLTSDLAQANAIASLIGNTPYYYNTATLQTNGPSKIMTNLGSNWGLYEPAGTGYQSYSYASGNTLYFSGSFGGSGVFYVQVNGTNSTFSI